MNLWDFIKIKSFRTAKETVKKTEAAHGMGEYICKGHYR